MTRVRLILRWFGRHWKAIASALTTLAGLVADPDMLGLLPAKWAHALTVTGIVLQLLSRAVHSFSPEPKEATP